MYRREALACDVGPQATGTTTNLLPCTGTHSAAMDALIKAFTDSAAPLLAPLLASIATAAAPAAVAAPLPVAVAPVAAPVAGALGGVGLSILLEPTGGWVFRGAWWVEGLRTVVKGGALGLTRRGGGAGGGTGGQDAARLGGGGRALQARAWPKGGVPSRVMGA